MKELKLIDVGNATFDAEVTKWLVKEGDSVSNGQNLVEVETAKANLVLPSPAAGVLTKILVPEGSVANVGDTLATIDDTAAPSTS
jgi:pyruvate/2-oxoglutarate dehydrogenase complex dihydrolipoamide acyltransferase (E2) component